MVTKDDYMPVSWKDKNTLYLSVSLKLADLRRSHPMDVIVHTKKMNKKFVELGSSFSKDIMSTGIRLI